MAGFQVESIAISKIHVGQRRREKVGDLRKMKASLERVGQIHPITIRPNSDGFDLVAGERRMKAAGALGWKKILARVGKFTDEELRQIELDENEDRTDLTPAEASRAKLRQIEAAEREAEEERVSSQAAKKRPGRPKGGNAETERRTGLSDDEIARTKRHVAAFTEFPILTGPEWSRSEAVEAAGQLDSLSRQDQKTVLVLLDEPGVPKPKQKIIIARAAEMTAPERKETLGFYRSDDEEKQGLAKSRLTRNPPQRPMRIVWLRDAIKFTEKAQDDNQRVAQGDLRSALRLLKSALKASERKYRELRKSEGF